MPTLKVQLHASETAPGFRQTLSFGDCCHHLDSSVPRSAESGRGLLNSQSPQFRCRLLAEAGLVDMSL